MGAIYSQIDCDLPRDTRMIAVGPMGRLLYIQCVLYCRENLTDGFIDRLWVPIIAPDITQTSKHFARLVDVGALKLDPCGWRIPLDVWRKRNPLKAEVDASRQAEADRKARYREKSQRDKAGTDTGVPTGQSVTATSCPRQGEGKPEGEGKGKPEGYNSSSPSVFKSAEPDHDDDDISMRAFRLWAEQYTLRREPDDPRAFLYTMLADVEQHLPEIERLHAERPNATAESLATAYDFGSWFAAIAPDRSRRNDRHPTDCECESTGWLPTEDGVVPCLRTEWADATIHQLRKDAS